MGTHAIHCLHYIWQDHYIAVSPEVQSQKAEIPEMYERHYEHCVDYIRQFLMCKFDTTIMPFNWVLDHQNPTPNGNTIHKCVKWDFLQDWLKDRAVQMPEGFKWRQPADAVTLDWNPWCCGIGATPCLGIHVGWEIVLDRQVSELRHLIFLRQYKRNDVACIAGVVIRSCHVILSSCIR